MLIVIWGRSWTDLSGQTPQSCTLCLLESRQVPLRYLWVQQVPPATPDRPAYLGRGKEHPHPCVATLYEGTRAIGK